MKKLISVILLIIPAFAYPQAGEPVMFSGTNVSDDNEVSLNDFKNKAGVVVIFVGFKCPFDDYYRLRIRELINAYSDKVQFLLVNSYVEPDEAVDKMKMEVLAHGYKVPYLADKEQKIMTALGAKKSPEAFVLQRSGDGFVVVYSGAIDDNAQLPAGVKERYLNSAIGNLLAGKPGTKAVRATGCTIRQR